MGPRHRVGVGVVSPRTPQTLSHIKDGAVIPSPTAASRSPSKLLGSRVCLDRSPCPCNELCSPQERSCPSSEGTSALQPRLDFGRGLHLRRVRLGPGMRIPARVTLTFAELGPASGGRQNREPPPPAGLVLPTAITRGRSRSLDPGAARLWLCGDNRTRETCPGVLSPGGQSRGSRSRSLVSAPSPAAKFIHKQRRALGCARDKAGGTGDGLIPNPEGRVPRWRVRVCTSARGGRQRMRPTAVTAG